MILRHADVPAKIAKLAAKRRPRIRGRSRIKVLIRRILQVVTMVMAVKMVGPKIRTVKARKMAKTITLTKRMMVKTVSKVQKTVHTRRKTPMYPLSKKKVKSESPIMSNSLKSWLKQSESKLRHNPRKF